MNSKGKRVSILKKQQHARHDASATETSSSVFKGSKKIEFNRKKSIKEFLVGEDADTIWGNSYEVSTDGTPTSGVDVTLGNNTTCRSTLVDERNKENAHTHNVNHQPADDPSPNVSSNSWDLSISVADDEKRRIRTDASVLLSQSLNTTERLFLEPTVPQGKANLKSNALPPVVKLNDVVQAMDISPLKANVATATPKSSPRKMIYYHPRQEMFVEICDVPQNDSPDGTGVEHVPSSDSGVRPMFQTPTRFSAPNRDSAATTTWQMGTSANATETWNSHPQAMMNHLQMLQSNNGDLGNMSSDVDTTIAITNTVAKLLQSSGTRLSIPSAMDAMDESTTTDVPMNALARARPSFLPSQRTTVDEESQSHVPTTPPNGKRPETERSPDSGAVDHPRNAIELSEHSGEQLSHGDMTFANLTIFKDLKQATAATEDTLQKSTVNKSTLDATTASRGGLSLDFGISSLSLKLPSTSPEQTPVNRPKIFRPPLPTTFLTSSADSKTVAEQAKNTSGARDLLRSETVDKKEINPEKRPSESRQTIHAVEDMQVTLRNDTNHINGAEASSSKHMDVTYYDHKQRQQQQQQSDAVHARQTVAMEESPPQKQPYRSTVFEETTCVDKSSILLPSTRNRATVVSHETMDTTEEQPPSRLARDTRADRITPGKGLQGRRSIYHPEPMMDVTVQKEQTIDNMGPPRQRKQEHGRSTILEKVAIDETISPLSNEYSVKYARKTIYPEETITVDTLAVQQVATPANNGPPQSACRTIVCNDSMMLDVCTDTDEGIDSESSISCRMPYARNVKELSIHAVGRGGKTIDMTIARSTLYDAERCDMSVASKTATPAGAAIMNTDLENSLSIEMMGPAGSIAVPRGEDDPVVASRRMTSYDIQEMEEDNHTVPAVRSSAYASLKPIAKQDGGGKPRFTTHETQSMDATGEIIPEEPQKQGAINLTHGAEGRTIIQPSGVKHSRYTTHEPKDMDATKLEARKTEECSMFGEENLPMYSKQESSAHLKQAESAYEMEGKLTMNVSERPEHRSRIGSESQLKSSRVTTFEAENMNCTKVNVISEPLSTHSGADRLEEQPMDARKSSQRRSVYQMMAMDESRAVLPIDESGFAVLPADVTSYDAFLVNHEMSQGPTHQPKLPPKQRLTTYYMEGMTEAGLDSTRLSKEGVQQQQQQQPAAASKPRQSTYHVEAMDETVIAPVERRDEYPSLSSQHSSKPAQFVDVQTSVLSTPMQLSPPVERHQPPPPPSPPRHYHHEQHGARRSVYVPQEMESSLLEEKQQHEERRSADVRKYSLQMALEGMEGFSLLPEDDEDNGAATKTIADSSNSSRGTILYAASNELEVENSGTKPPLPSLPPIAEPTADDAPKYGRPTICAVEAMVEEDTVAVPLQKASSSVRSSMAQQRKSRRAVHACMEQTMIANDAERQIGTSEKASSPIVFPAEHPPSTLTRRLRSSHRGTINAQEMMELTGVVLPEENNKNAPKETKRRTKHQSTRMDMTLGPSESTDDGPVVGVNRRTIHQPHPMDETLPLAAVIKETPSARESAAAPQLVMATPVAAVAQQRESRETRVGRKPRQTILLPCDMEVEDGEEAAMVVERKEEEQYEQYESFTLAQLPRETTDDRVMRCAMVMPPASILRPGPGGVGSGFSHLFREPSNGGLELVAQDKTLSSQPLARRKTFDERGRCVPPSSTVHELSDISLCNATMHPEPPQIGNITGVTSMREVPEDSINSVSVICRVVDQQQQQQQQQRSEETRVHQSLALVTSIAPAPTAHADVPSDDEFYDAEDDDDEQPGQQPVDPLSLTKSRHHTMKFVDVELLERTEVQPQLVSTSSKRVHAQVLRSSQARPMADDDDDDPLQLTRRQTMAIDLVQQHTPQGPLQKRPRTTGTPRVDRPGEGAAIERHEIDIVKVEEIGGEKDPLQGENDERLSMAEVQSEERGQQKQEEQEEQEDQEDQEEQEEQEDQEEQEEQEDQEEQEEKPGKEEGRPSIMTRVGGGSQSVLYDPSVFVIEDEDLIDDESNISCISLTEELLQSQENCPAAVERGGSAEGGSSKQPFSVGMLKELSFYRDFANLTIDNMDSWEGVGEADAAAGDCPPVKRTLEKVKKEEAMEECDRGVACISLSDDDDDSTTAAITPPKRTVQPARGDDGLILSLAGFNRRTRSSIAALDSTLASDILRELDAKHPQIKHVCCEARTDEECLCRMRRELERRTEASDLMWQQFCSWFEVLKKRTEKARDEGDDGSSRRMTFEEKMEELNWRLHQSRLEQSSFCEDDEMDGERGRHRRRPPISGQFPETPSVVFLYENLRSYLSERIDVDTSPPPGATLPAIPRITLLLSNKLSSDSGSRWQLDCSQEGEGLLLLRHRTLRSVVISVQLQQRGGKGIVGGGGGGGASRRRRSKLEEDRRLERIQVRESRHEYVHSPKLLLAHIEFMRLAKETTERTLRSAYRTVASLMGLWQHFDELLSRVFDSINRLLTIVRNNDALLHYDAAMERFYVKKYFQRCLGDGSVEGNMLTVHFTRIGNLSANGVNFQRPIVEMHKILPATGNDQQSSGTNGLKSAATMTTRGKAGAAGATSDDQTGLMFLECLLWNVSKHFES